MSALDEKEQPIDKIPEPRLGKIQRPLFLKITCYSFWVFIVVRLFFWGVPTINTLPGDLMLPDFVYWINTISLIWIMALSYSIYGLSAIAWHYFLWSQVLLSGLDIGLIYMGIEKYYEGDVASVYSGYYLVLIAGINLIIRVIFTTLFRLNKHHYS